MKEIIFSFKTLESLQLESEKSFPATTYGFLFGEINENKWIKKAISIEALKNERYIGHSALSLSDYRLAEKFGKENGYTLLGAFHSQIGDIEINENKHLKVIIPHFSYVIISIIDGQFNQVKSWTLNTELKKLEEEKILINASQLIY